MLPSDATSATYNDAAAAAAGAAELMPVMADATTHVVDVSAVKLLFCYFIICC